jgi:hypothetical protein
MVARNAAHFARGKARAGDAETNGSLVRAAGLEVLVAEIVGVREPESQYETAFLWVLARKPR